MLLQPWAQHAILDEDQVFVVLLGHLPGHALQAIICSTDPNGLVLQIPCERCSWQLSGVRRNVP
jgi:hypothetical protein